MKTLLLAFLALATVACNKPIKTYECEPGTERPCMCLNDVIGEQECSKGPIYYNWTPRAWVPCSCCWDVYENDHGPYLIEKNDASGCWTDAYDPSTPTYDTEDDIGEDRGLSDG